MTILYLFLMLIQQLQENDPWVMNKLNIIDDTEELSTSSSNLQNIILETRNNAIDEAKEKLTYYNKIFNSALMLYEREKTNDQFVKNFDTLLKPFAKAIEECEEKLNALTQQKTWGPKNGKLSFWLH
ncbi:6724_t:CDS:1 [Racocetra persica]|uniref:6724_t:CDS:1 n=1 Tax=Racocetra persica TaxID=160502 RepID=A0ACA9SQ38_9GLOM|nr:6724_t:CDS:1 [Racocetra persica]